MKYPFKDRADAAKQLAHSLKNYKNLNPLVLAIPCGGVEIGAKLADFLQTDFSIVITRKLPLPHNPEAGFGAIAEDGSTFLFKDILNRLDDAEIKQIKEKQTQEIKRRKQVLRNNKPLPTITDRTIILTDDGIAMGSTMRATIAMLKKKNPEKIVVAVPVAGPRVAKEIDELVDETVILRIPTFFRAVAQVYEEWYDVSDEEVISIMTELEKN